MQLGMIGLGRMGANMVLRLMDRGHDCVVYDRDADAVQALVGAGALGAGSLEALVANLSPPRRIWMMIPAAHVDGLIEDLAPLVERGDVLIDGGNSYYKDDIVRARRLAEIGIHYVDVGTSGGVWGRERGYCLMIGGEPDVVTALEPIFTALAPGVEAAPRTPGREGPPTPAEQGWLHCGPAGAGHLVKMVHNGIEYGLMAAYAEGLNLLQHMGIGRADRRADAETAPLREPEAFQYAIDLSEVTELWRRGSVIGSWLLDLTAQVLHQDPALASFSNQVADSGEGRWTSIAAVEAGVPIHVLSAALFDRFASRGEAEFANRVLSAMRYAFGGHEAPVEQGS